nr:immunoglobulin heavy chain junction region [Mus musculus]
SVQEGTGSLLT